MTLSGFTMRNEKPNIILGYTTRRHLVLDLDNTVLSKVLLLVLIIQREWEKVGDCLIVLSSLGDHTISLTYTKWGSPRIKTSRNNYHLVFDSGIGYNSSCRIISVLAGLNILNRDYLKIRKFRGDMSLRISPSVYTDKIKPFPKPICYVQNNTSYKRGGYIDKYLSALRNVYLLFPKSCYVFDSHTILLLKLRLSRLLQKLQGESIIHRIRMIKPQLLRQ